MEYQQKNYGHFMMPVLCWPRMRARNHTRARPSGRTAAVGCLLVLLALPGAEASETGLGYREFRLGQSIAEARGIIAASYRGMDAQRDAAANAITITQNEQNNERVILRFDAAGTLYAITTLLGRDKDSIYLSKLLNFLENKYGKTTVESGGANRGFIWRAVWRLQNGRYGINAEYTATGVAITYRDIAADERMQGESLRTRYDAFKALFVPRAGSVPATLRFAEFRLGDTRAAVVSMLARLGARPGADTAPGKCRNGRAIVTARLADRSEIRVSFDNADAAYEIVVYRPDADQRYIVDLLRFMRSVAGEPVYANEEMYIGRWEFEGGALLFTASFTDRATVSLIDKTRLDRCIADVEKSLFKDL